MAKNLVAVLMALALVVALGAPAASSGDRVAPKGDLHTTVIVHYVGPDHPEKGGNGKGKGGGGKPGGGGGDKDLTYFELLGPAWSSLPVSYTIDPSFSPVDPVQGTAEIRDSMEAWDAVTAADLFAEPGVGAVTLDFYDLENTVTWRILTGYPKAIAVTVLRWYDNDGNEVMSPGDDLAAFDVVLNLMQKWGIDPDGEGPLKADAKGKWFDVRNIMTHEAGHVVGLADLYNDAYSELTMYGYASPKETKKVSLEAGDTSGTQALYGS